MQCVSNLMSNAVKFVEPGVRPRAEVFAGTQGERARLAEPDNGVGIGPAMVWRAMERMGGSADFCSEPGKGSRFCLELTLAS